MRKLKYLLLNPSGFEVCIQLGVNSWIFTWLCVLFLVRKSKKLSLRSGRVSAAGNLQGIVSALIRILAALAPLVPWPFRLKEFTRRNCCLELEVLVMENLIPGGKIIFLIASFHQRQYLRSLRGNKTGFPTVSES